VELNQTLLPLSVFLLAGTGCLFTTFTSVDHENTFNTGKYFYKYSEVLSLKSLKIS